MELGEGGRALRRDEFGNALGGIRNPWVDVPLRVLSGEGQQGEGLAYLFGTTFPLEPGTITRLYPGGRGDYLTAFTASLDQTIADGFILEVDREEIIAVAAETYNLVSPSEGTKEGSQ